MAVDVRIESVDTNLSAVDPAAILTPQFLEAVVEAVRTELEKDRRLEEQRTTDHAQRTRRRL